MTGRYLAAAFEALLDILQLQGRGAAGHAGAASGALQRIAQDLLQLGEVPALSQGIGSECPQLASGQMPSDLCLPAAPCAGEQLPEARAGQADPLRPAASTHMLPWLDHAQQSLPHAATAQAAPAGACTRPCRRWWGAWARRRCCSCSQTWCPARWARWPAAAPAGQLAPSWLPFSAACARSWVRHRPTLALHMRGGTGTVRCPCCRRD